MLKYLWTLGGISMLNSILHTLLMIITNIYYLFSNVVYIITLYYLVLSFFGIIRRKNKKNVAPEKTFALIVAAHNEEAVVKDIVGSLKKLDYPKSMYDIFVIADNCTDNTAKIARDNGAIVFERVNNEKRGKGYALEWMFDKIFKMNKKYDAVVIFDADNLASKNFLMEMNKKLCGGYKVVQGYLDSKNPRDTWITGSYSIAFWCSDRMFQLSRSNLGLSIQLGGTGFAVDTEILKKLGWGATCLTEDLEFTCKLVINGYKVGWAHDAVVYDEKPLTMKQSWAQRRRWMQGFADVSSRYTLKLIKKAITSFSFVAFDCALYSIQPAVIVLTGLSTVITAIQYVFKFYHSFSTMSGTVFNFNAHMILTGGILIIVLQFLYTPFMILLEKKLNAKVFLYYLIYPIYSLTWIPITIQGILNKNNKEWSHTKHTRSVDISDLEKAH